MKNRYKLVTTEELSIVSDEKWIQDAFSQAIRLIRSSFIPVSTSKTTEDGLLKRIWNCIDTCYDFSPITYISLLSRQKPDHKMELYRRLSSVIRTILAGRQLMEITATMLSSDDSDDIMIGRCQKELIVPNFMPTINTSKRRKHTQQ
ncbi:hypothetical protein MBANPS3_000402 [Mucor bainieri]